MYDINVLIKNGINVNRCLEFFGNIEMYNETLNDFLNSIDSKISKLEEYISSGNIKNYGIDIHALKSDARYLGFESLSDASLVLENACINNSLEQVKQNHTVLLEEVKKSISIAKQYFNIASPQDVESTLKTAAEFEQKNDNAQSSIVNSVQPTIKAGNLQAVGSAQGVMPVGMVSSSISQTPAVHINLGGEGVRPIIKPKLLKDKVLIVDDSNLIIKFVSRALSNDYEVLTAKDGAEAIAMLDDQHFRSDLKLCLLDLNMPNVDGYQVLEHCKTNEYFKDLPIAVESGIEDATSLDKVNEYPVVGILLKPFKEGDLRRVVDKSLVSYF